MAYKITFRNLHRDTAYFYVGLIISFSISGIALNHRSTWNPREYVVDSKDVLVELPTEQDQIDDAYAKQLATSWEMASEYKSFRIRGESLRLYFDNAVADIDLVTGKGDLETIRKRPLLNEMTLLHQTTSSSWIYYSDVFGLAMLLIAITGMFIASGKDSFRKRGWKFASVGILFPLVFLLFLA